MSSVTKFTILPETAAEVLQDLGYRGKINRENETPVIESATNGARFWINFRSPQDGDTSKGFEEIQFDTGFAIRNDVNTTRLLLLCNRFNADYRFVKLTLLGDEHRYISMKADIPVNGESRDWFVQYVTTFIEFIRTFIDEIVDTEIFRGDRCSEPHCEAIRLLHSAERDPIAAINFYRIASERGYAGSQNNLGDLYETAEYLAKSDDFAVYWYTRAAERGEPTAYLSLSTLLGEKAVDVSMRIEALKFAILAINGLPEGYNKNTANACAERLREALDDNDIATAEAQADAWLPLYQERRLMSDKPHSVPELQRPSQVLH